MAGSRSDTNHRPSAVRGCLKEEAMKQSRGALLTVGALAAIVGGCECSNPVPQSQLVVAFTQPLDGQQLSKADDLDAAADGLQIDVDAQAQDTVGRDLTLASAELLLKADGAADWTPSGVTAVITGGNLHFARVTLPQSNVSLRVNVSEASSSRTAFHQISVGVPTGLSCTLMISSPSGANPLITQAQDAKPAVAGGQFKIEGASNDCLNKPITVQKISPLPLAQLGSTTTDATGRFTFAEVSLAEGETKLKVEIDDGLGNKSSVTLNVTVDVTGPTVTLVSPTELGGPYTGPLVNVSVNVTGAAAGSKVSIYTQTAMGTPRAELDVVGTSATGVVTFAAGTQTVIARAVDDSGNIGEAVEEDVVIQSSTLAITAPIGPTRLFRQANDTQPATTGFQSPLQYMPAPKAGETVDICVTGTRPGGAADCPGEAAGSAYWRLAAAVPASNANFTYPEGTYQIKAVLNSGPGHYASPAISLVVDTQLPTVTGITFQGDANSDGWLNLAELPLAAPRVAIIAVSGVEDGRPLSIYDVANPALRMKYGEATVNGGVATVTLTSLPMSIGGSYPLVAEVSDLVGNVNQLIAGGQDPVNAAAFTTLQIDQQPPTVAVGVPSKAQLGIADDFVPGTASVYDLRAEGISQSDAASVSFELTGPGGSTLSAPATGGVADVNFTLPFTGTNAYTLKLTPTDRAGNVGASTSFSFTIDVDPPTVTLTSPTALGSPYGFAINTSVTATGAEGQMVEIKSSLVPPGVIDLIGPVTSGAASKSLTYPTGTQTITATVQDAAGNVATSSQTVAVVSAGCSILITAPSTQYLIKTDDLDGLTANLQYIVRGTRSNCTATTVTLYRDGTLLGTTSVDGAGAFTYPLTLAEGTFVLRAEMNNGIATYTERTVTVDITAPSLSGVTPAASAFFVVAPTNGNLANPAYVVDGDPATADGQLSVGFTAGGAQGGTARVSYRGTDIDGPRTLSSASQAISAAVVVPHNTSGPFEIRLKDVAGNETLYSATLTVDVIAPAIPVLTQNVTARTKVGLSWTASNDDGSTGGAVAGYDLRWTTEVVSSTGIPTEAVFLNSALVRQETGALLPSATTTYPLTVPWLTTYGIVVRAKDEVGNYSTFVPSVALPNIDTSLSLTRTNATSLGTNVAQGDLNGDGRADVVATSSETGTSGVVSIFYGAANLNAMPVQHITMPLVGVSEQFGADATVGRVDEIAGMGYPDLLVGAPGYNTNQGRAYLYFGQAGQLDSSAAGYVVFEGNSSASPTGVGQFGRSARIIGDTNGDGIGEVVLSAHAENALRGRVYLFYGRSRAQWNALVVSGVIPVSKADKVFEGPFPVATVAQGNQFGQRRGFAYLGDITGDGAGDFTIPDSQDAINRVWVFSGAAVSGSTAPITTGTDVANPNQALQTLSVGAATAGTTTLGFGTRAIGNINVIGGAARDLIVASHRNGQVHIFPDGSASGFGTTPFTIAGTQNFGAGIAQGDLDGDGNIDLVCGESVTGDSSLRLFFNRGSVGSEFDQVVGSGFAQSRSRSVGALGGSVAVGDFNGDGKPDVAAGDTSGSGRVTIWY